MRPWHVLVVLGALCLLLGYRVVVLDSRVDALSQRLAKVSGGDATGPVDTADDPSDVEQRIALLEEDLEAIQQSVGDLNVKTEETKDDLEEARTVAQDERIVQLMVNEQRRVMHKHMDFHKQHWDEQRTKAVDDLAKRASLTEGQAAQLHGLLRRELDQVVGIFKHPDTEEDPHSAASDMADVLRQTDRMALRLLNADQARQWRQYREFERKTLMPWLPPE